MANTQNNMPQTREGRLQRLQGIASGLQSPLCTLTTLTVNMVTYSRADLTKLILGWIAIFAAVNQTLAAYHDAVKTRNGIEATVQAFLSNLLAALEQSVGGSETALALYGFRPEKERRPLTIEEQAEKLRKARETRQKNDTMGVDQKKALDDGGTPQPGNSGSGSSSKP